MLANVCKAHIPKFSADSGMFAAIALAKQLLMETDYALLPRHACHWRSAIPYEYECIPQRGDQTRRELEHGACAASTSLPYLCS